MPIDPKLRKRISEILKRAAKEDWSDTAFSVTKAQVCVELAALVYEDVQPHELKKNSRIHLFASDRYRQIVSAGAPNILLDLLVQEEFQARFFVVRGRYAVALGTVLNDVVILAIRGTVFRRLWDWKGNLDARRYYIGPSSYYVSPHWYRHEWSTEDLFFHRGFFESVVPHFGSIADAIEKIAPQKERKIVWTGHSLGGAMAAIGSALSQGPLPYWLRLGVDSKTVGAYTFGMPRYGGLGAVCFLEGPHHIYNPDDIVPTVPLRKMGFADSAREYQADNTGLVGLSERTDTFGVLGRVPRLLTSIKAHSIDGYADSLSKATGLSRP